MNNNWIPYLPSWQDIKEVPIKNLPKEEKKYIHKSGNLVQFLYKVKNKKVYSEYKYIILPFYKRWWNKIKLFVWSLNETK